MSQKNLLKKLIKVILIFIFIFLFRRILKFVHKINLIFYHEKAINKRKLNSKQNPKISVIIPVYNGGKYLNYSLKSVQNQKMKDIEIIIIDDNSSDDSLKIIYSYMKNDERIRLIENKVNRKILFCKSIGALNSKGKYIIELDQDDMFIRNDAFDIIYNESERYELDILSFKHVSGDNPFQRFKRKNYINSEIKVIKQPKLKLSMFNTYIYLLWGNLIRGDLYKKVIYNLWPIIISYKIIFQEDFLITFFALIYARKSKMIKDRILFHYKNLKSASKGYKNNSEYFLSVIFAGNIFYDYHIDYNPLDFPILINYINYLNKHFQIAKNLYPSLFNFFFGKILSNSHLGFKFKNDLMIKFNISENCDSYPYLNCNQRLFLKEIMNNKSNSLKQTNPIIRLSILIIFHSNFDNVSKLIKSLKEQNFDSFEIILIFDNIEKNSFNLIEKYLHKNHHIKLITNKIQKGILSLVSEGVTISKGKYLMVLDENCYFLENNALKTIYDEIEKDESNILEIYFYRKFPNNYTNLYKCKHFSSKFNLTHIKYNLDYNEIDVNKELLANKIINTNYFKNCLKKYKLNKINEIIDNYYNEIFLFILESNTYKYKHTSLVKLYKNDSDFDKFKFNDFISKEQIMKEIIFKINFFFENSEDTYEAKEKVLNELLRDLSIIFNKFSKVSESSIKLLNKFMNCNNISNTNKNILQFYYKSLIN